MSRKRRIPQTITSSGLRVQELLSLSRERLRHGDAVEKNQTEANVKRVNLSEEFFILRFQLTPN